MFLPQGSFFCYLGSTIYLQNGILNFYLPIELTLFIAFWWAHKNNHSMIIIGHYQIATSYATIHSALYLYHKVQKKFFLKKGAGD